MRIFLACVCCAALAGGCRTLGLGGPGRGASDPSGPGGSETAAGSAKAWNSSPVLYTRDGMPLGAATSTGPSPHDLSGGESGRTYILELYQEAVEARNTLQLEVTALQKELEREQSGVRLTEEELRVTKERVAQLEAEREELLQQNITLAGRLTHAQVRRLEAEKLLLETRLQEIASADSGAEQP